MLDLLRPARANCEGPAIFIGPFWREALRQSASDLFLAPLHHGSRADTAAGAEAAQPLLRKAALEAKC